MSKSYKLGRYTLTTHRPVMNGVVFKRAKDGRPNPYYQNILQRSWGTAKKDYWMIVKIIKHRRSDSYHFLGGFLPHVRKRMH